MISLLGGKRSGSVCLTHDELRSLEKVYEFHSEENPLLQAGADRNLFRHAEADGLRVLAWLSRYTEPGQDPLKVLVGLAVEAGLNVDPEDCAWAEDEEEA
jgi:hypothetical protein